MKSLYQSTNLPMIKDPNDRQKIHISIIDLLNKINNVYLNSNVTDGSNVIFPNGLMIQSGEQIPLAFTNKIKFAVPFTAPPMVLISLDCTQAELTNISTSDIIKSGFNINIGAFGGTRKVKYFAIGV